MTDCGEEMLRYAELVRAGLDGSIMEFICDTCRQHFWESASEERPTCPSCWRGKGTPKKDIGNERQETSTEG